MLDRRFSVALALALLPASVGYAQDASAPVADAPTIASVDTDARLHFELGRRAYARADYETALDEFQQALALSEHAELHYNLFLVFHELDRDPEAVAELRAFLPHAEDPETRAQLESRLARLEAQLADREAGLAIAEPAHEVVPDAPAATVELGETVRVRAAPAPHDDTVTVVGVLALSLGGAALAGSAIAGGMALGERDALAARCAPSCADADTAQGRSLALASDVSLGIGLALAAAGAVLLVIDAAGASTADTVVTAWVTPGGAAIAARGSF